jgi:hypothetical protein
MKRQPDRCSAAKLSSRLAIWARIFYRRPPDGRFSCLSQAAAQKKSALFRHFRPVALEFRHDPALVAARYLPAMPGIPTLRKGPI